ncbi:hypothetical protein BGM19_20890 [Streptomyces agglomeratus]|uniref:Lipoprotein n=1 Tax=Streptomyces agglomeratus TaxID=285458 RepID=A0A1E5P8D3_9ACTN|nr:hypothetical protein [Streptomyces agglomeratus]OEJ25765.1 hypothetical protein AS594_15945 [Streptomyces agglomeratus]OEJ52743.1 hypothetical protein BGK72_20175 [Streptomyces agglomeratus]OEJ60081.1 hypothetical protein BGM19_20890 [Streptomyces agglomeratus]
MREYVRTTFAAAAVAAALVLTGCSGDSGGGTGGDKGRDKGAGGSASRGAGQSSTGPSADQETSADDVAGSWIATTDGKIVALIIQGSDAAVAGEHVCAGTAAKADKVTLKLKCGDGNTDRTTGVVTRGAGGDSITVKWGSGIEDSFKKSAAGDKLPEGIPSDMPKLPGS